MIRLLTILFTLSLLSSCWPTSVSFNDTGSMNECLKSFNMPILDMNAPTAPAIYPTDLTEAVKNGIQNNTRLMLVGTDQEAQVTIEGKINAYTITPVALQQGDVSAKNRLTISASFVIFQSCPENSFEEEMTLTSTRFADYDSNQDISSIEQDLLQEINDQIVQDVINKLLSNW